MVNGEKKEPIEKVKRYEPLTIPVHWLLFVALGGLSVTGLITIFTRTLTGFDTFTNILGGVEFAQTLHRLFAVSLIVTCVFFAISVIVGIGKNGLNSDLLFTPRDFFDILRSIRAVLTGGRTEPSGAYHWGMKAFFWQIVIGTAVLGITGLDMMEIIDISPLDYGLSLLLHDIFFWVVFTGCILHVWAVLFVGNEPDFSSMITGYMDANYARRHYPNWDFEGVHEKPKPSLGQKFRKETAEIAHGIEQPIANWIQRRGIVKKILNWGRAYSPWPIQYGIGCCMAEGAAAMANRWDIERFGILPLFGPRQTDVLMISGAVNKKMLPRLLRIYEQMPEPKFVICFGSCAMSGGAFWDNYSLVHPIDDYVPVDVFVPGCPPKPDDLVRGFMLLEEKIRRGDTHWHHMHGQ